MIGFLLLIIVSYIALLLLLGYEHMRIHVGGLKNNVQARYRQVSQANRVVLQPHFNWDPDLPFQDGQQCGRLLDLLPRCCIET